jgi:hypothetical protein
MKKLIVIFVLFFINITGAFYQKYFEKLPVWEQQRIKLINKVSESVVSVV